MPRPFDGILERFFTPKQFVAHKAVRSTENAPPHGLVRVSPERVAPWLA
jgi:hypothetical protein